MKEDAHSLEGGDGGRVTNFVRNTRWGGGGGLGTKEDDLI